MKKGNPAERLTLRGTPSISGRTLTLTLSSAVAETDTNVTVAYELPNESADNRLVDAYGHEAAPFGDQHVFNRLGDSTPPALAAPDPAVLAADGLTLTLTYNEPLDDTSVSHSSTFTVKRTPSGGDEETVGLAETDPVAVSGRTVVLKLARPIAHNDGSVKVSYAKSKGAYDPVIRDANGNDAPSFVDEVVTNNSEVPRVGIRALHEDASPVIAWPVYEVTRSLAGTDPLDVEVVVAQSGDYYSGRVVLLDHSRGPDGVSAED